ncbi:methyltransferase domain-containing protein [Cytophagales bacterium RKSG123]|nr:methyltransferase domain-containing protein [Xanthovirga aplysinae]
MKICTDACILGAWTPTDNAQRILDIGTGTGLLSLMIAQRSEGTIEAVEIDPAAFQQASDNFSKSLWNNRLHLHHQSIQQYMEKNQGKSFDLIISNPPFYTNHQQTNDYKRNRAHHDDELPFEDLLRSMDLMLSQEGTASILLPPRQMDEFIKLAISFSFFPVQKLQISDNVQKPIIREVCLFKRQPSPIKIEELTIREENGEYAPNYKKLLKDYLLIF